MKTIEELTNDQAKDFAELIATGSFPLLPQSLSRFNLIPVATAALERIDTLHKMAVNNPPQLPNEA
jgi:hypothetical protein